MTLWALPPGVDFAGEVVRGLRERFPAPEAMARVTLLANSARTLTTLREAFAAGPATLLPRMRLVGTLGEGPLAAPLARQLELMRLISRLVAGRPDLGGGRATPALAASLADLMAEMQREGVPAEALTGLDVGEHAAHWQDLLGFLRIAAEWALDGPPRDMPARQRAAAEAALRDWPEGRNLPPGPVVVAGSTGSQGATRLLLMAVAALPEGHVIVPGYDPHMPLPLLADAAEDHPQARLQPLIAAFGAPRPWRAAAAPPAPARNALVSLALRPAPVTDSWIAEGPGLGDLRPATEGLTLLEAESPQAEAEALALLIRDAVGRQRPATLITGDRGLARRVTAALDRWRLIPDDSAGVPLSLSPEGMLLRQTAALIERPPAIDGLIALLKSGPVARGFEAHPLMTRRLELHLRRHGPAFPGGPALRAWPAHARQPRPLPEGLEAWSFWLADILDRLQALAEARAPLPLPQRVAQHRALTEALAAGPGGGAGGGLWDGEAGEAALAVMESLARHGGPLDLMGAQDYADLLGQQLQARALRHGVEAHPLIRIRGPREARTEAGRPGALILLGGLTEGSWPQAPAPDPWLSQPLRHQAGLTTPARAIGLATHDAQQGLAAAEVVLSRALRDDEAETLPSRWLVRLTNLIAGLPGAHSMGPESLQAMRTRGRVWLDRAAALVPPIDAPRAPRPAPVPPPASLRRLSVTDISTLIRDPFAVYARHILRLSPLDPLRPAPDPAERGTVLHRIMAEFLTPAPAAGTTAAALQARLLAVADRVLAEDVAWPAARVFWRTRLAAAAPGLMRAEADRLRAGRPQVIEAAAEADMAPLALTLSTRADRIDRLTDGRVAIFDYKTGKPPSAAELRAHDLQLPLTVAMARRGVFRGVGAAEVAEAAYLHLGGEGQTVPRPEALDLADEAWRHLTALLRLYLDGEIGFLASARGGSWGTYDHLARMGEWSLEDAGTRIPVGGAP